MKRINFLILLLFASTISAFCVSYKTEKALFYYPSLSADDYLNSQCKLDVYYPADAKDFYTIVWFHGGGLTGGIRDLPAELKDRGLAVVSVSYRLSPKAKHPSYIEDAAAAVAWVYENIEQYGGNRQKIVVAGHSAGGYLALMLALDKARLAKYNIDPDSQIAYFFPISGQCTTHYTIREEYGLPKDQWWIDKLSPIFHARKTTAPIYLTTGERSKELPLRYEENLVLKWNLEQFGNTRIGLKEFDGLDHGTIVGPALQLLVTLLQDK